MAAERAPVSQSKTSQCANERQDPGDESTNIIREPSLEIPTELVQPFVGLDQQVELRQVLVDALWDLIEIDEERRL